MACHDSSEHPSLHMITPAVARVAPRWRHPQGDGASGVLGRLRPGRARRGAFATGRSPCRHGHGGRRGAGRGRWRRRGDDDGGGRGRGGRRRGGRGWARGRRPSPWGPTREWRSLTISMLSSRHTNGLILLAANRRTSPAGRSDDMGEPERRRHIVPGPRSSYGTAGETSSGDGGRGLCRRGRS